ncbi:hypothetical protein [Paraburkholderia youngii]|uniref:hypothetical protein n=1 Tax=Paraburkholderia youngii TaxID=2782701 RepID=UPI001591331A|nr:hypothetical protein [Paraburkholderia youngii]NUX59340.1 hypothetical protein [Paraburkholderia youngii]
MIDLSVGRVTPIGPFPRFIKRAMYAAVPFTIAARASGFHNFHRPSPCGVFSYARSTSQWSQTFSFNCISSFSEKPSTVVTHLPEYALAWRTPTVPVA